MDNQQTKTKAINLHYIVNEPKKQIPWTFLLFIVLFIVLVGIGVWVASKQSKEKTIAHRVQEGDTITTIAVFYYDNPQKRRKIFSYNRDKILNDETIKVGDILYIPLSPTEEKDLITRLQKK